MPAIASQTVTINFYKLVKDGEETTVKFLDDESVQNLEEVIKQLVDDASVLVEVTDSE